MLKTLKTVPKWREEFPPSCCLQCGCLMFCVGLMSSSRDWSIAGQGSKLADEYMWTIYPLPLNSHVHTYTCAWVLHAQMWVGPDSCSWVSASAKFEFFPLMCLICHTLVRPREVWLHVQLIKCPQILHNPVLQSTKTTAFLKLQF
jgi:hypothetical protein